MKKLLLFLSVSVLSILLSCNSRQSAAEIKLSREAIMDSAVTIMDSASPQSEIPLKLNERNFLRTASLKFKVNSIGNAIVEVENTVRALGGYASLSQFKNIVLDSNSTPISEDSLMRTIQYSTQAVLVVKVPDFKLDSLLTSLNGLSTMMFTREIHCDDISIQLLANQQKSRRAATANQRLKSDIDRRGKKLPDIGEMEKTLEEKEAAADDAKISSLSMEDAVKFSTVSIEISQDPFIHYTKIARARVFPEYNRPYSTQIMESFSSGWQILKDLTILITKFWSVLLMLGVIYLLFNRYFPTEKKIIKQTLTGKSSS